MKKSIFKRASIFILFFASININVFSQESYEEALLQFLKTSKNTEQIKGFDFLKEFFVGITNNIAKYPDTINAEYLVNDYFDNHYQDDLLSILSQYIKYIVSKEEINKCTSYFLQNPFFKYRETAETKAIELFDVYYEKLSDYEFDLGPKPNDVILRNISSEYISEFDKYYNSISDINIKMLDKLVDTTVMLSENENSGEIKQLMEKNFRRCLLNAYDMHVPISMMKEGARIYNTPEMKKMEKAMNEILSHSKERLVELAKCYCLYLISKGIKIKEDFGNEQ